MFDGAHYFTQTFNLQILDEKLYNYNIMFQTNINILGLFIVIYL